MSKAINASLERSDWTAARRLTRAQLRREPTNHWLLTRLSLTYYEQHDYHRALRYSREAIKSAPRCPLVLWDYAGALDMLGRKKEALRLFRRIARRGVQSIASGLCGEGLAKARGLVADCLYREAGCYSDLGNRARATKAYRSHLRLRGPGCRSIYPIRDVRRELSKLQVAGVA